MKKGFMKTEWGKELKSAVTNLGLEVKDRDLFCRMKEDEDSAYIHFKGEYLGVYSFDKKDFKTLAT